MVKAACVFASALLVFAGCKNRAPASPANSAGPRSSDRSIWEEPHNARVLAIAKEARERGFLGGNVDHPDRLPYLVALGSLVLKPPNASYVTTLHFNLNGEKFQGWIRVRNEVVEGKLHYRQVDEVGYTMRLLAMSFPNTERALATEMLLAGEQMYQADVQGKSLRNDFSDAPFKTKMRDHSHFKGKRAGEEDWSEFRVELTAETADYQVAVTIIESTGEEGRAVVEVELLSK